MTASPSIDDSPSQERADAASDTVVNGTSGSTSTPGPWTTDTTAATSVPIDHTVEQSLEQSNHAPTQPSTPISITSRSNVVNRPLQQDTMALLEQLKGNSSASKQQQHDPFPSFEAFFSVASSPEERGMSFEEMLMANEAVAAAASAATAGDTYRSPSQDILLRPTSPFRRPFGGAQSTSSPGSPSSRTTTTTPAVSARSTPRTPTASSPLSSTGPISSSATAASPSAKTANTTAVSSGVAPIAIPVSSNHNNNNNLHSNNGSNRGSQDHDGENQQPHSPSSDPSSIKTILSSAGYFPGTSPEEMEEAALDYRLKGRSRASRGYSADFSTNNWTSALGIGSGHGPTQPGSPRSMSPVRASRQDLLHGHGGGGGSHHHHHPPSSPGLASSSSQQDLNDHHALSSHSSSTHHLAHQYHPVQSGGENGDDGKGRGRGGARRGEERVSMSGSSTEELPLAEFLAKSAPPPTTTPPRSSVYQLPEYPSASNQEEGAGDAKAVSPTSAKHPSGDSGAGGGSSSFQGPRVLYAGFPNFHPPTSPPPTDGLTIHFSNQTSKIPITSVSGDFTGFQDFDAALEEVLESPNKKGWKNNRSSSKATKQSGSLPHSSPSNGNNSQEAGDLEASATTLATGTSATAAGGGGGVDVVGAETTLEDHEDDIWVRRYKVFPGRNVFLLQGRIMTSRDFPAFAVAVMFVLVPTGLFHGFVSPYLWKHLSPAAPLVQAYLFIVTFSTMLKTSWTDPGVIPRGLDSDPPLDPPLDFGDGGSASFYPPKGLPRVKEIQVGMYTVRLKYCDTCRIYRPPRCSHCRQCDNCVEDEDHHCIWLNNCIGRRNYKYFWIFVTTAALYAFLTAGLCLTHLFLLYNEKKDDANRSFAQDAMRRAPVSAIVMLFAFVLGCAVGALAGYHYWLATMNRTTHEQLGASMMKPHEVDNPFDRGSIPKNCAAVLCRPPTKSYVKRRDYILA